MTDPRPDLVLVVADDHAAHASSAYSSDLLATPKLDRIAAEGIRFDSCYSAGRTCATW